MRRISPNLIQDVLITGLLFLLPLIMFWPQTVGGHTLLPTENLYQYEPFYTYREAAGAPETVQNELLSDLVLQNYQWKSFIRDSIDQREIPLWNPHQFGGIPFLAAGQQSALYPPSILYYVLPLPAAYGWFTVVNLWLAGLFMYAFLRGLGLARLGGAVAGITYQLCGFFIASAVHPMIIGAGAWLPLILLMVEYIIRQQTLFGRPTTAPWVVIGAGAIACNIFAGHVEITIYTLLMAGYYAVARLLWDAGQVRKDGTQAAIVSGAIRGGWLLAMVGLGVGLAAVQFIPLYEFASTNWRAERGSFAEVLSFAHPPRDLLAYVMPNFYGSPAQNTIFDWFTLESVPAPNGNTDWAIKNYVEGALYVGILPLMLAAFAVVVRFVGAGRRAANQPPYVWIFLLLTLIALSFMFGTRAYAVIYALPNINQLNTAFRWVFGVTAGVAVLAGFGADALTRLSEDERLRQWAGRFATLGVAGGGLVLVGLLVSRVMYSQIDGIIADVLPRLAARNGGTAADKFSTAEIFYSFQLTNALIFGVVLLLCGVVFRWAWLAWNADTRSRYAWGTLAVVLVGADLIIASWGFNPASDPDLLDYTPPAIEWLQEREAEDPPFRYITLDAPGQHRELFQANLSMRYGLDDVRGYESIISGQYVDYMRRVQIQPQLDFNRVAPLYLDRVLADEVDWGRLALLNVRYVITHVSTELPEILTTSANGQRFAPQMTQVYSDEAVRIYEMGGRPRAWVGDTINNELPDLEDNFAAAGAPVTIWSDTGRERQMDVQLTGERPHWLIISETYAPGWRAFVRPFEADADLEQQADVIRILENFQGVPMNPPDLRDLFADVYDDLPAEQQQAVDNGVYTVRMVYSPQSFQVGAFGSVISAAILAFLIGVWIWRLLVGGGREDSTSVSRVARNSVAPIILNLFNRGIDFAFAVVMLRILGPEDAGIYYYAIVVFVWFDIFTNFGLDVFLIREAARDRSQAGRVFLNTTYLRGFLVFACVPLLLGFVVIRQATIDPALNSEALLAIGLLYIGLAPASISKGLTSLFYAFEKAEYPAAVTTVTTINKTVLGLIALLLGYGIVGLAGVSILVNLVTVGILAWSARGMIFRQQDDNHSTLAAQPPDRRMIAGMTRESWPLMLNHFLATIFFQIDVVILEAMRGARIVGQYSVAYRWLLALNIIPAFFTQALLPVMSRQASEDRAALKRTYTLGIKLLTAISVPVAVAFTFMAEGLVLFLGGAEFMPAGAIALQIMIWSIPIGWMNSLTQYALVAVDRQRTITWAFFLGVSFNIITNLIFIPQFGYQAAAVTTIFSEAVLLIPFGVLIQHELGTLDWLDMIWRPVVASAAMGAVLLLGWPIAPVLALIVGAVVYPVVLLLLRPLSDSELTMLEPVLPGRVQRVLAIR